VPAAYAHLMQLGKEGPVAVLRNKSWNYAHRPFTMNQPKRSKRQEHEVDAAVQV